MSHPMRRQQYAAQISTENLLSPSSRSPTSPSSSSSMPLTPSVSDRFFLAPSPAEWGAIALSANASEPDDFLHNPDPRRDRRMDQGGNIFTGRGIANLGCLLILALGCLMLFAGFPILSHFQHKVQSTQGGFNFGGTNSTGQVATMPGNFGLIDVDTPQDAYSKTSYLNPNEQWDLVFSDEFNVDGRTFWPGDDPYWEAVDLHYWQTNDLEWYHPSAATTKNGALQLTLYQVDPAQNHNLSYRSGMIQSWNKFCFTGGMIEVAVTLPGSPSVQGLWPAVWTMGNLGRAGYGASLDGMWPYSYDSCDVGTLANQTTTPGSGLPVAAVENGDPSHDNMLSYLPGQRLSACTCPGQSHPGPVRADGSYVGRSSPEIDIFEALVGGGIGQVSQSAQWAPFNAAYEWLNTSQNLQIYNTAVSSLNTYIGGAYQQTTSGLSNTDQDCYQMAQQCFSVYGFEYIPGFDDGYITWVVNGTAAWTLMGPGMGPDTATEIGPRIISEEPMYIIANLGFSMNFGAIDFDNLVFPAIMSIDYVRVYQPPGQHNIGCDPADHPTQAYINAYIDAYTNPNLTGWSFPNYNQTIPKNNLTAGGCPAVQS